MSSPASIDAAASMGGKGTQVERVFQPIHLGPLPLALLAQHSAGDDNEEKCPDHDPSLPTDIFSGTMAPPEMIMVIAWSVEMSQKSSFAVGRISRNPEVGFSALGT